MIKRKQPTGLRRMWLGIRAFCIGFIIYPIATFVIAIESLFKKN
jgi:hypothetical protein